MLPKNGRKMTNNAEIDMVENFRVTMALLK